MLISNRLNQNMPSEDPDKNGETNNEDKDKSIQTAKIKAFLQIMLYNVHKT